MITGIKQGLGLFLAKKFASAGWRLVTLDMIPINAIDHTIRDHVIKHFQLDLSDPTNIGQIDDWLRDTSEYPSVLINNAALKSFAKFMDFDINAMQSAINVNFTSLVLLTHTFVHNMNDKTKDRVTVINISSNAAYYGHARGSLYCSTKSAVLKFTEALADEFKGTSMCFSSICSETIATPEVVASRTGSSNLISMEEVYKAVELIIHSTTSKEIALLSQKTKLRYLYYEIKKFISWFKVRV